MVSPLRSLLLLAYVSCICVVVAVLSPRIITLGSNSEFRVFTLEDFELLKKPATIDTAQQQQLADLQARQDSIDKALFAQAIMQQTADSLAALQPEDTSKSGRREKIEPVNTAVQKIEFPTTNQLALDKFFEALRKLAKEDDFVRVVHYGDSQIEGDRITEYLRERLQDRFGGCGPGLLPPETRKGMRQSIQTDFSKNWRKYAYIDSKNSPKHKRLGLLQAYYSFVSPLPPEATDKLQTAWVKYTDTEYGSELLRKAECMKLIYNTNGSDLDVEVRADGKVLSQKTLSTSTSEFDIFELDFEENFKTLKIDFKTEGDAEVLGVSIDCESGVAVDNVPMRGSSGAEFSKIQKDYLKKQFEALDTKLIIMQFGVNVVPSPAQSYKFYENLLYRQIMFLQSINPDANIVVVGLSDMARKNGLNYESYPNIEKIRDAQRNAALKAGCAFWDLYAAMGGHNSMVSWVNAKPSLAGRDYTHFNARGAKLVAQLLYDAMIFEYEEYKKRMDD